MLLRVHGELDLRVDLLQAKVIGTTPQKGLLDAEEHLHRAPPGVAFPTPGPEAPERLSGGPPKSLGPKLGPKRH